MIDLMVFKTYVRKVLGRRTSNAVRNALVSIRAGLGLLPRVDRPNCVSALMRVRDEEWWIEPSILSIKDLVNEYVIMDASTDRTPEIIEGLRRDRYYAIYWPHIFLVGGW